MESEQGVPEESTLDPSVSQTSDAGESEAESLFLAEETGQRNSSQSRATGEHPSIYAPQGEEQKLPLIRTGHEHTSSPQAENEPEDNLPDLLDRK